MFDRNSLEALADAMGVTSEAYPALATLGVDLPGRSVLEAWEALDPEVRPVGAFVYVPFCRSKCAFCPLPSHPPAAGEIEDYLELLARELRHFRDPFRRLSFQTLHVGGGTPSIFSADEIHRMLDAVLWSVNLAEGARISFEANPSLMGEDRVRALALRGVHRVNIEVMSFDPAVLSRVNRGYQAAEDVRAAVRLLRDAGIPSVSMELMAGLPDQPEESLLDSVKRAVKMGPDVIQVRPFEAAGSDLSRQGLRQSASDFEATHEQIRSAETVLADAGYVGQPGDTVYARSVEGLDGFARDRFARSGSVAAFGAHADGHVFGRLLYGATSAEQRREALLRREVPPYRACRSDLEAEMREFMARNVKVGVERARFRRIFGREPADVFSPELAALTREGLVEEEAETIRPRFRTRRDALVASMAFYPDDLVSELCRTRLGAPYPLAPASEPGEETVAEEEGPSAPEAPSGSGP